MKKILDVCERVVVEVRKYVPLQSGSGYTTVRDGCLWCERFRVEIDAAALVRAVGDRAIRNLKRVSKVQGGAVVVVALDVHREEK